MADSDKSLVIITKALTWKTTLDFSRRYVLMFAPMMSPFLPKPISIYFPKRLLLSFRVVLAFPIDCRQKKVSKSKKSELCVGGQAENPYFLVVIPHLHDRVGGQDPLFYTGLLCCSSDHSEISHGEFGWDCLPWAGLSADDDGLVFLLPVHTYSTCYTRLLRHGFIYVCLCKNLWDNRTSCLWPDLVMVR